MLSPITLELVSAINLHTTHLICVLTILILKAEAEALLVDGGTVVTDKRSGMGEVVSVVKAAQASPPSISSSKKSVQSVVPGSTIEAHVDHFSASVAKNGMNADVTEVSLMRTQTLYWQHIISCTSLTHFLPLFQRLL